MSRRWPEPPAATDAPVGMNGVGKGLLLMNWLFGVALFAWHSPRVGFGAALISIGLFGAVAHYAAKAQAALEALRLLIDVNRAGFSRRQEDTIGAMVEDEVAGAMASLPGRRRSPWGFASTAVTRVVDADKGADDGA